MTAATFFLSFSLSSSSFILPAGSHLSDVDHDDDDDVQVEADCVKISSDLQRERNSASKETEAGKKWRFGDKPRLEKSPSIVLWFSEKNL